MKKKLGGKWLSLVFTNDISISQITEDNFSADVSDNKAEIISFEFGFVLPYNLCSINNKSLLVCG